MDDSENDYYEEENYIDDFEDAPEKDIDEASGNFDEDDIHYNCKSLFIICMHLICLILKTHV